MTKRDQMDLFRPVDGGRVVIVDRGLFRQVGLYEWNGFLFAARRTGFVRLLGRTNTTIGHVKWEAIDGVEFHEVYNGPRLGEEAKEAA